MTRKTIRAAGLFFMVTWLLSVPGWASGPMALSEAIQLARETVPAYKAQLAMTGSSAALYDASLGPYFPLLDVSTTQNRVYPGSSSYDSYAYTATLSYLIFDGFNREATRGIARSNLDISNQELRRVLLDLDLNVKTAFYTVIAAKDNVSQRKLQLQDSEKDFEVAEGRYKYGVARLSDMLQASVRLEQARFNVIDAEAISKKALSDLNSLIGRNLDSVYEVTGTLDQVVSLPPKEALFEATLQRPELKEAESSVTIAKNNKTIATSRFWPAITANAGWTKTGGGLSTVAGGSNVTVFPEYWTLGISATWNLFDLGKFYQRKSAEYGIQASKENYQELKRQFLLGVQKAMVDYLSAVDKVKVAEEQLKQSQQNYDQAFGEYKVGKGDILSLVQAETLLSQAREQLTLSQLSVALSKSALERAVGVDQIDALSR